MISVLKGTSTLWFLHGERRTGAAFSLHFPRGLAYSLAYLSPRYDLRVQRPHWIGSVGMALRLSVARYLSAEVQYGHALKKVDTSGHNLQDRGIHFRVSLQTR